jgi:hypothetical protein
VLGRDNYEVFTQILGLSDAEFIDLMQQGMFEQPSLSFRPMRYPSLIGAGSLCYHPSNSQLATAMPCPWVYRPVIKRSFLGRQGKTRRSA